jgi:YggT family protein
LAFFKEGALILLSTGTWGNPFGLLLLGLADVLDLLFYIYLFTLIAVAASNWLNPTHVNPLIQIASQIITPLLKRIRFDLAPFFLAILLILFNILIIQTIAHIGVTLLIPA